MMGKKREDFSLDKDTKPEAKVVVTVWIPDKFLPKNIKDQKSYAFSVSSKEKGPEELLHFVFDEMRKFFI